jgi:hypothetical protein
VIGRGGQAMLALISYWAYTKALVRLIEAGPIPYGTFEAALREIPTRLRNKTEESSLKIQRDISLSHRLAVS